MQLPQAELGVSEKRSVIRADDGARMFWKYLKERESAL